MSLTPLHCSGLEQRGSQMRTVGLHTIGAQIVCNFVSVPALLCSYGATQSGHRAGKLCWGLLERWSGHAMRTANQTRTSRNVASLAGVCGAHVVTTIAFVASDVPSSGNSRGSGRTWICLNPRALITLTWTQSWVLCRRKSVLRSDERVLFVVFLQDVCNMRYVHC